MPNNLTKFYSTVQYSTVIRKLQAVTKNGTRKFDQLRNSSVRKSN
jgi:hypothetical protein